MNYIFLNNQILSEKEAHISPLDRGFLYGDGLFETIKAQGDHIFFLKKHLARIQTAAQLLKIPFPIDLPFPKIIKELIKKSDIKGEGAIKICLSRGKQGNKLSFYEPATPTLVIMARPYVRKNPAEWEKGLTLSIEREIVQNTTSCLSRLKSLNYLLYLLIQTRAQEKGYGEGLLINAKQEICECTTANIFFYRNGRWETPAVSCGILPGILRDSLIECLKADGQSIYEVEQPYSILKECEEIFITNSLAEIMPVGQVDQDQYNCREKTREVLKIFQAYRDWLHNI